VPNSLPLILARRRRRRHDLPSERRAMLGIGRNQSMQEGGSAAWQADNKKRFANFLVRDLRIKLSISFHQQAIAKCANQIGTKGDLADQVQSRVAVAGFEQTRERLEKVTAAEILEPATPFSDLDQVGRKKWGSGNVHFLQPDATLVKQPDGERRARLLKGGGVHSTRKHVAEALWRSKLQAAIISDCWL
jgi:hypothetical protein